jgi:alkylation response protein AidB-like acyl-CoA dehydrogenase
MEREIFATEHEFFRESARTFVEREIQPHHERWRQAKLIDRELWLAAGRQGLLGLDVPERYGGSEACDYRFNAILSEELARAGLAFASSMGIQFDVVAPYLIEMTTDEQRERWLPRFCSGELVTAIGMTEPGAGSDLRGIRTQARKVGRDWVLNGSKTFITNGQTADLVVVAARTGSGARDLTLFGVEAGMEGFSRGRKLEKVGQHEADTSELFFEDVRVPSELILGEVDRGFAAMITHLPRERLHSACVNVAHAAEALRLTLEYVTERHAFGQPIGTFQNSRFLLAELSTEIDVTQAFVDRCIMCYVEGNLSAIDAAKAKWWTAEVQNRVIDACVQLHGGYGYMEEYAVARAWTDARVTRIWAGSNEIMKDVIARGLGLAEPRPSARGNGDRPAETR